MLQITVKGQKRSF